VPVFKVLVANRFSQESLLQLRRQSKMAVESAEDLYKLKEHWPTTNGILIRSGSKISREVLDKMPALKVIITATSGFDHIDLKEAAKRNITVMHTPGANAQSAAEHAWGLIIASQRKYLQAWNQTLKGRWERDALIGRELRGRTLGIIGFGRIGKKVYQMAKAFEMTVRVHDPYVENAKFPDVDFFGYEEVVRKSDIVTYHVPLTSETKQMIKAATLDWFNDDATLVNISRGEIMCLSSMLNYMGENPDFHLALDVFPTEPLPADSALLQYKNIFFTPHVGATTEQAIARASLEGADKMIAYVEKGTVSDTLPPHTLWAEKLL
jgi:D-3-phosphoglycerate dehydrogenase